MLNLNVSAKNRVLGGSPKWGQRGLLVCFALVLAACSNNDEEEELIVRPVRTVTVSSDTAGDVKTFSGVSQSSQESTLSFKVSGTVESIPANVGDQIKAGEVIASLDASTYELQLQQAQATVAQSSAADRNAAAATQSRQCRRIAGRSGCGSCQR